MRHKGSHPAIEYFTLRRVLLNAVRIISRLASEQFGRLKAIRERDLSWAQR